MITYRDMSQNVYKNSRDHDKIGVASRNSGDEKWKLSGFPLMIYIKYS